MHTLDVKTKILRKGLYIQKSNIRIKDGTVINFKIFN